MFDTVFGLPTHILVIHAVVVLGPLAGLVGIAYAARAAWRPALRWPLVALAAIAAVTGIVATESGEQLEHRVFASGASAAVKELVEEHSEAGELARTVLIVFFAVALAAAFWALRPLVTRRDAGGDATGATAARPAHGAVAIIAAVALALSGVAAVVTTTIAGHKGATASWSDAVQQTNGKVATEGGDDD